MNNTQRNKLNMYKLLKDFLLSSEAITNNWKAFAALFLKFCAFIVQIEDLAAVQAKDNSGIKVSKASVRNTLIEAMLAVARKCMSYAKVNQLDEFYANVKMTKSKLKQLAGTDLITDCQSLIDIVREKLSDLSQSDVTEENIKELEKLLSNFKEVEQKPQDAIKNKKKNTAKMNSLFKDNDAVLKTIDSVALAGSDKEPDFYQSYQIKRKVLSLGVHKTSFKLLVIDAETGKGKANVEIRIKAKDGKQLKKNIKLTGKKGHILIQSLEPGEYTYEIIYLGYESLTATFYVHENEMTNLEVILKKKG